MERGNLKSYKDLAKFCAIVAQEKIAKDIIVIELTSIETAPTDFFVLCSCDSDVQMRAIVDEIIKRCNELNMQKPRTEGLDSTQWILLDFFTVVMHIMHYEARRYYNIERLWGDGEFYKITETGRLYRIKDKTKIFCD